MWEHMLFRGLGSSNITTTDLVSKEAALQVRPLHNPLDDTMKAA
jgi:hypothetical protein